MQIQGEGRDEFDMRESFDLRTGLQAGTIIGRSMERQKRVLRCEGECLAGVDHSEDGDVANSQTRRLAAGKLVCDQRSAGGTNSAAKRRAVARCVSQRIHCCSSAMGRVFSNGPSKDFVTIRL